MSGIQLKIIHGIQSISNDFFDFIFEFITFFGEAFVAIAVVAFFYWIYNKKEGQKMATILITSLTFNGAIKGVVKANRPFMDDSSVINKRPSTATGYSFPSGHSQTAATFYTSLMVYFKKNWLNVLLSILIFLVMFSRLYLGAHYPVDVIVGGALGILFALLMPLLIDKIQNQTILLTFILIIFIPFAVFFLIAKNDLNDDFFKMFGLLVGTLCAYVYERKFVNFTTDISRNKKIIRYITGIIILLVIQLGLKSLFGVIFPNPSYFVKTILNIIRYGSISFVGLGLYPHIFTKLKF